MTHKRDVCKKSGSRLQIIHRGSEHVKRLQQGRKSPHLPVTPEPRPKSNAQGAFPFLVPKITTRTTEPSLTPCKKHRAQRKLSYNSPPGEPHWFISDFDDRPTFASLFYHTVLGTNLRLALCSDYLHVYTLGGLRQVSQGRTCSSL